MEETRVIARLVAIWQTLDGIKTVYEDVPRVIPAGALPAVVIVPSQVVSRDMSMGAVGNLIETRQYDMYLYVAQALLGTSNQSETSLKPFFDSVTRLFFSRPDLSLNPASVTGEFEAALQPDNGYQILQYATGTDRLADHAGAVFPIHITTYSKITMND